MRSGASEFFKSHKECLSLKVVITVVDLRH